MSCLMGTIRNILRRLWQAFVQIISRGSQTKTMMDVSGETNTNNSTEDLSNSDPVVITKVKIKKIKIPETDKIL